MNHLQDITNECGCYELGEMCYDKQGNPTHLTNEECDE